MSNMNKQQNLEATISQLSEDLTKAQKELDEMKAQTKWQPRGDYVVLSDGRARAWPAGAPAPLTLWRGARGLGNSFPTYEAASAAAKHLRVTYRLLAYVAEFAPGFKQPELGALCPLDLGRVWKGDGAWGALGRPRRAGQPGVVYMPYDVAVQLADKLNSGEVEL